MVSCVFLLLYRLFFYSRVIYVFFLMIRRPPRSTRLTHSFPTRRSSDLTTLLRAINGLVPHFTGGTLTGRVLVDGRDTRTHRPRDLADVVGFVGQDPRSGFVAETVEDELAFGMEWLGLPPDVMRRRVRSEEHTSELQSLMRIAYAVFCL